MHCNWKAHSQGVECTRCGCIRKTERIKECDRVGLGDMVAGVISYVFPRVKKCGGCKKRQEALNKVNFKKG